MTIQKILHGWRDKKAAFIFITEFVGIRSNIYSHIKDGDKGGKTAKGIKKNVIKKNIKHEDYKDVLFNNKQMHQTMKSIRSNNHQLWSYEPNKVSLSCFDYKRYMLNGINSYVMSLQNLKRCDVTTQLRQSSFGSHVLVEASRLYLPVLRLCWPHTLL